MPHTRIAYPTQATISSVKQCKANVTLCLHRMRVARKNTIEVIIISDALYTGCCVAQKKISDRKLLPRSIYDVLTQISNDFQWLLFRVQCRQTLAVAVRVPGCPPGVAFPYGIWSRHCVTHLSRRNKAISVFDRRPSAP